MASTSAHPPKVSFAPTGAGWSADALDEVIEIVPSLKSPTVNELFRGAGYAVETVVPKDEINILIPQLRDKGATDIVELPISKIIP
mgnify:CR=1 FL=1